MAELSPVSSTKHGGDGCNGIGKFDCSFDEEIFGMVMDDITQGDAEAPSGWWSAVDLDIECYGHPDDDYSIAAGAVAGTGSDCDGSCTSEWRLSQHYGSPWLIIGGNDQGFVRVVAFASEELRQTQLTLLEEQYEQWYDTDGDQL